MFRFSYLLLAILLSHSINAQIFLSEKIQDSKLASSQDKALFLIDFWATWCAPCITAGKYLGVLQEEFNNDLYILSLSKESPETVFNFIEKHPSKLAVSIDFDGTNFKNHKVNALPWSFLFDAEGNILWKGNPSNLKSSLINKFLRQTTKRQNVSDFFVYQSYEKEDEIQQNTSNDFQLTKLNKNSTEHPLFNRWNEYITIEGSFQHIIGYLLDANKKQIEYDGIDSISSQYELKLNTHTKLSKKEICNKILKNEHLDIEKEIVSGKIFKITLPENEKLYWDTFQFEWGDKNPIFLINDSEITADNISVDDLIYQLMNLKNTPYKIIGGKKRVGYTPHDWLVHYIFFNLMQSNLNDYNIKIEETFEQYPYYRITKSKGYFSKILSIFKSKK